MQLCGTTLTSSSLRPNLCNSDRLRAGYILTIIDPGSVIRAWRKAHLPPVERNICRITEEFNSAVICRNAHTCNQSAANPQDWIALCFLFRCVTAAASRHRCQQHVDY